MQPAQVKDSMVVAELPAERSLVWFVTRTDDRKATVSAEHEVVER